MADAWVSQLLSTAVVAVFNDISAGIPELGTREGLSLYHGDIRNDQPLHEDMRLYTNDVYAASKLRNGHQLRLSAARTGYSAITAHLFNAIGWGDSNGHLVPESLKHQKLYSAGTIDRPIQWKYYQKTYHEVGWQASIPISHSIDNIAQM